MVALLLGGARASGTQPAWAPKLRASVKPTRAHLGDPITVALSLEMRKGVTVSLPAKLELGKFVELSRKSAIAAPPKAGSESVTQTITLSVAAYELGALTLPRIAISAVGPGGALATLYTEEIPIHIEGTLANEPNPQPRGLEPPVSVYQRSWWLLYALGGLLAIAAIAWSAVRAKRRWRQRERPEAPAAPPPPPETVALARLDALEVERLLAEERFKELYLELSEIVREYIGALWHFEALEMTTSEIRAALVTRAVDVAERERLHRYLCEGDLVKFARFRPEPDVAREAVREARAIVLDTARARREAAVAVVPSPNGSEHR